MGRLGSSCPGHPHSSPGHHPHHPTRNGPPPATHPVTFLELVVNLAYTLALVAVVIVTVLCLWMATAREDKGDVLLVWTTTPNKTKGHQPCCLPYKFQAVVAPLSTFDARTKQVLHVYRDWEGQRQAMEQTTFTLDGIADHAYSKTLYDYKHNTAYRILPASRECTAWPINSGMLEPCMPDDAEYLGKSYVGLYDNKVEFDSFYFRRTDKNRSIEMTISVTSDRCVPVMEHIKGQIGSGPIDSLVFFSNLTTLKDEEVFRVPDFCRTKLR